MVAWKLKLKVHSFREIFALITLITQNKRFECVFGSFNKKNVVCNTYQNVFAGSSAIPDSAIALSGNSNDSSAKTMF
jgi:hypothetical protein